MTIFNPYVNAWFIGAIISLFIFDKMGSGDDEESRLIRNDMLMLAIFWPLVWTMVLVSLIKDLFTHDKTDN